MEQIYIYYFIMSVCEQRSVCRPVTQKLSVVWRKHRFGISGFPLTVKIHFHVNFCENKFPVVFLFKFAANLPAVIMLSLTECKPLHVDILYSTRIIQMLINFIWYLCTILLSLNGSINTRATLGTSASSWQALPASFLGMWCISQGNFTFNLTKTDLTHIHNNYLLYTTLVSYSWVD